MSDKIVIIPTYNERDNIVDIIKEVLALIGGFNVLIIDDGSPDGTAGLVKSIQSLHPNRIFLVERSGKLGLGTAYITGFKYALERGYNYIFEMDADFSHNPKDLIRLHQACVDGADLAIGSRYVTGVNVVNWPMTRVLMSYYASWYVRRITAMTIRDATAGFKCYRAEVLRSIDLDKVRFVGYAFQIEMKFTSWLLGFKIVEVPIIFTDRTKGQSKMSSGIFKEAAFGVLQLKINSFFNKPKRNAPSATAF